MRKWFAAILVLLLMVSGIGIWRESRYPFRALTAKEIAQAHVTLTPPDVTVPVTDKQTLARLLSQVVLGPPDSSYTDYAGQGAVYTLTWANGTRQQVTVFYPFVIVDGVGYRTSYQPCENLNRFGNELLRQARHFS